MTKVIKTFARLYLGLLAFGFLSLSAMWLNGHANWENAINEVHATDAATDAEITSVLHKHGFRSMDAAENRLPTFLEYMDSNF